MSGIRIECWVLSARDGPLNVTRARGRLRFVSNCTALICTIPIRSLRTEWSQSANDWMTSPHGIAADPMVREGARFRPASFVELQRTRHRYSSRRWANSALPWVLRLRSRWRLQQSHTTSWAYLQRSFATRRCSVLACSVSDCFPADLAVETDSSDDRTTIACRTIPQPSIVVEEMVGGYGFEPQTLSV